MNIKKLCTSGQTWTYAELRQLHNAYAFCEADEEFRKEIDSFWTKRHPMVATVIR